LPVAGHLKGVVADDGAVSSNAIAMEGGLGEAALAKVQRLFAGEQAIAENEAGTLHDDAAVMMRSIADEHLLHESGVVQLKDMAAGSAEVDEVAIEGSVGAEQFDGAGTKDLTGEGAAHEGGTGRSGEDTRFKRRGHVLVGRYRHIDARSSLISAKTYGGTPSVVAN
jgi:hypothetical protein